MTVVLLGCVEARPTTRCWACSETDQEVFGTVFPWCCPVVAEMTTNASVTMLPESSKLEGDKQDARGVFATSRGGDRSLDVSNNVSFIHFGSAALSVGTIILMVGLCALVGYCAIHCRGKCMSAVEEATSGGRLAMQPLNQPQQQLSVQPASQPPVQQMQPALMAPTEAFLTAAFAKMGGARNSGRFEGRRGNRDQFDYLRRQGRYDNDYAE